MRRLAALALTAALLAGGTSAALAQPGPPNDVPAPPDQAQGSSTTGEENSAEARAHASEQAGFDVPAHATAEPNGSPATGEENSAEARAHAAEQAGFDVPARDAAREDGREFGQQRADDARARGGDDTDEPGDETVDPAAVDDAAGDAGDVELPAVPAQADQARGVLATLTETLRSALDTLMGLFGLGADAA